jgi:hypothetical protein
MERPMKRYSKSATSVARWTFDLPHEKFCSSHSHGSTAAVQSPSSAVSAGSHIVRNPRRLGSSKKEEPDPVSTISASAALGGSEVAVRLRRQATTATTAATSAATPAAIPPISPTDSPCRASDDRAALALGLSRVQLLAAALALGLSRVESPVAALALASGMALGFVSAGARTVTARGAVRSAALGRGGEVARSAPESREKCAETAGVCEFAWTAV